MIPSGYLDIFPNLVTLSVIHNQIEHIEENDTLTIPSSTKTALLHNNHLSAINLQLRGNLSALEMLDVGINRLTDFPYIRGPIARVVQTLLLDYNHLTMISTSDMLHFVALQYLNIMENDITRIGEFSLTFRSEFHFEVNNNPLHCDSQVMWMKKITEQLLELTTSPQPCAAPSELAAQDWDDIHIDECELWLKKTFLCC